MALGNYNKVIIIGRATRDAEMIYSPDGTPITKFGVAWNKNRRKNDGTWESKPTFFNVVCFRELAERAAEQVERGAIVLVEGSIESDKWTDKKTGQEHERWQIVANTVRKDTKREGAGEPSEQVLRDLNSDPDDLPF